MSYRETDTGHGPFIFPTTTPVQFDPEALKSSIRMLAASEPDCMYLTHYGRVGDVQRLAVDMEQWVDILVDIALGIASIRSVPSHPERDARPAGGRGTGHGVVLPGPALRELFEGDVVLNTQGIEHWLDETA